MEAKAVDLYVLQRAIVSGHDETVAAGVVRNGAACCPLHLPPRMFLRAARHAVSTRTSTPQFDAVFAAYLALASDRAGFLTRFDAVRQRGRKRLAFG